MASTAGNRKIVEKRKSSPKLRRKFSNSIMKGKLEAALSPSQLKLARMEKNISQVDIAKKLNISQASYASVETKSRPVREDRAKKIAKILKLKAENLFEEKGSNKFLAL